MVMFSGPGPFNQKFWHLTLGNGNENWKKIENALNLANYCFAS